MQAEHLATSPLPACETRRSNEKTAHCSTLTCTHTGHVTATYICVQCYTQRRAVSNTHLQVWLLKRSLRPTSLAPAPAPPAQCRATAGVRQPGWGWGSRQKGAWQPRCSLRQDRQRYRVPPMLHPAPGQMRSSRAALHGRKRKYPNSTTFNETKGAVIDNVVPTRNRGVCSCA